MFFIKIGFRSLPSLLYSNALRQRFYIFAIFGFPVPDGGPTKELQNFFLNFKCVSFLARIGRNNFFTLRLASSIPLLLQNAHSLSSATCSLTILSLSLLTTHPQTHARDGSIHLSVSLTIAQSISLLYSLSRIFFLSLSLSLILSHIHTNIYTHYRTVYLSSLLLFSILVLILYHS